MQHLLVRRRQHRDEQILTDERDECAVRKHQDGARDSAFARRGLRVAEVPREDVDERPDQRQEHEVGDGVLEDQLFRLGVDLQGERRRRRGEREDGHAEDEEDSDHVAAEDGHRDVQDSRRARELLHHVAESREPVESEPGREPDGVERESAAA